MDREDDLMDDAKEVEAEQGEDELEDAGDETGSYVLDLDADEGDPDEVAREALESVERKKRGSVSADELGGEPTPSSIEEELEDLRSRSARTLADFENYRKRAERERNDLRRFANVELVRDFLPVVDNLDRALEASGSIEDLKTGVEMIVRQLHDVMRQNGVEEVAAIGEPFDPNLHEAMSREEDDGVDVATVVEELQKGYVMHGRLLRPALVKVAVPPEGSLQDGDGEEGGG